MSTKQVNNQVNNQLIKWLIDQSINQSINQSLYSGLGGVRSSGGVDTEPDRQRQHPVRQQVRGEEIQAGHSGMRTSTGSSDTQCWR